jgi:predicted RecA/RadA family phage recombinase
MTKAASLVFAGVAYEQIQNSTATDGAVRVKVYKKGIFEFIMASAAVTDVGTEVYALDNQTVTKTSTDATKVGKIMSVENTNKVFIEIGGYC